MTNAIIGSVTTQEVSSIIVLKTLDIEPGNQVRTLSYDDAYLTSATPAIGGTLYEITTLAAYRIKIGDGGWTPDGTKDFYLDNGHIAVDLLAEKPATVAIMKTLDLQIGTTVSTESYYAYSGSVEAKGGATYQIMTLAQWQALTGLTTPDGYGDHVLANGNVAMLDREETNALMYGAKNDNTDAATTTSAVQAYFAASSGKEITFTSGTYLINNTISLDGLNFATIRFLGGARINAGANNITIFKSVTNAWGVKIFDPDIRGNTFTGVIGFDCIRLEQLGAGLYRPVLRNLDTGIFLRSLCTGVQIDTPDINGCDNPIIVLDPAGGVQINHPRIDTFVGIGIDIRAGVLYGSVGTQILGGYIQNGAEGVRDKGVATNIIGTYFETCTVADIKLDGSRFATIQSTNHTSIGNVAIFARNSDGARVVNPFMSSGGRTVGLFDFDASNTNCFSDFEIGASTENTPVGSILGINPIAKQISGTFTPIVSGSGTAGVGTYTVQTGKYTRIGDTVHIDSRVSWTSHTGTGNLVLDGMPANIGSVTTGDRTLLIPEGFAFTGPIVSGGFNGVGRQMTIYNTSTDGTLTLIVLPGAGTLRMNATFTVT